MYFRNFGIRKTWLIKSLKSPLSYHPSRSNMQEGPNTVEIWTVPPSPYLLITLKAIELEKTSRSDMQSLKNVCYHIHWRWQLFSS